MTSNGKQPQNIKNGIFQQPVIGSYSNFKPKLRKTILKYEKLYWKKLEVEYLRNPLLDHTQILNLS